MLTADYYCNHFGNKNQGVKRYLYQICEIAIKLNSIFCSFLCKSTHRINVFFEKSVEKCLRGMYNIKRTELDSCLQINLLYRIISGGADMSKKILIACDSEQVSDFISNFAAKEGFTVRVICDISCDIQHVVRECCILHPDIIFLGGCYLEAEQECRHSSLMSDIYVLGKDDAYSVQLPLDIKELTAIFEKYNTKHIGECGTLKIDNERNCAVVGDKEYPLSLTELEILRCFIMNPNRVFSKEQLAYEVFGPDVADADRQAEEAVGELKSKLDGLSSKWSIRLLWGVGYKFEVNE